MPRSTLILLGTLGLAIAAFLYSRSRSGSAAVQSATSQLAITASDLVSLVSTNGYNINNPLNIRFLSANAWNGQIADHNGYGEYDTPQSGTRAAGHQLFKVAQQYGATVGQIVSVWAPSSENNTQAYIDDVCGQLGVQPNTPLNLALNVNSQLPDLTRAMAKHENGYINSDYDFNWSCDP